MDTSRLARKRSSRRRGGWLAGIRIILMLTVLVAIVRSNRKQILDRIRIFNKHYTNPRVLKIAARRNSPYAVLHHVGRHSGNEYTTPVVADFAQKLESFVIPLPYGSNTDWCRNVMAAGRCTLIKDQVAYTLVAPTIIDAAAVLPELPAPVQRTLRALGLQKFMQIRIEASREVERPVASGVANK
ncbi:hypothetical protein KDA_28640 [Dictyobacter alpinus]|uniref:Nitroreductase n=1 Tax=Dictyobacter alpinus TaxID=2014873 RepID=A0A402B7V9_9CHLR|nr:nitroreductase family deazaflavin-dependent oxidoreductase [Dictyobacter alpinus]GCE27380.1 hypothetical protein KDA_28640 [Dictyobacter alpinus]